MNIIFTSKGKKEGISTDEVKDIFENSDDLEEIKNTVENADDRLSVTWSSVEMKDQAGELIPIDDIIKQQGILLERNGPRTDEHTNRIIGQTLAFKVMENPETNSTGVLHLDKTFDHNELDDKIWKEIQSGERKGDSVGGFNTGESKGVDEVTGEKVTVLEGFKQLETASVFDPCNPEALTEAYSVVAKSKGGKTERIKQTGGHRHTEADPEGLHTHPEIEKSEDDDYKTKMYINKLNNNKNIKEGDIMKTDTKKAISKIEESLKSLQNELAKLKKEEDTPLEEEKQEEEEGKEPEEKKKKQEEEEKPEDKKKKQEEEEPEEKKKKQEEEEIEEKKKKKKQEEDEEVTKEEARSDIDGEEPATDQPEPVEDPDKNDADVFKQLKDVRKELKDIKKGMTDTLLTPRPGGKIAMVKKYSDIAMDIATGKKKTNWMEVHKMMNDASKEVV